MKLALLFETSMSQGKELLNLYLFLDELKNNRLRKSWKNNFFNHEISKWRIEYGVRRLSSNEIMLIGTRDKIEKFKFKKKVFQDLLLKSAIVFGMAAFDKLMHEIVLKKFSTFSSDGHLDEWIKLPLSKSYLIAQSARIRKGKGGNRKKRPGNDFKREVSEILFKRTFLSSTDVEKICKGIGVNNLWEEFSKTIRSKTNAQNLKGTWNCLYQRRNNIAHELDIFRALKSSRYKFREISYEYVDSSFALITDLANLIILRTE